MAGEQAEILGGQLKYTRRTARGEPDGELINNGIIRDLRDRDLHVRIHLLESLTHALPPGAESGFFPLPSGEFKRPRGAGSSTVICDYAIILCRRAITGAPAPMRSGSGARRRASKRCADSSLRASIPLATFSGGLTCQFPPRCTADASRYTDAGEAMARAIADQHPRLHWPRLGPHVACCISHGPSREVSAVLIAPSRRARSGRTRAKTRTPIRTPSRCCAKPTAGREDAIVPSA